MPINRWLWSIGLAAMQVGQIPRADTDARLRQGPLLVAEVVFTGTVTSVEDGDSIVVKTPTELLPVQIVGVDAPELSQAGGPEARTFLIALVIGKSVTVRLKSVAERIGAVDLDGTDVSETLIRRGMAWHCPRFTDDRKLTSAEAEARASKRGLWTDARPMPPWLYRGAGECWLEKKRSAGVERPDFSGTWTAISPVDRVGQRMTIRQDAVSLTLEQPSEQGTHSLVYKLDGTTSRALSTPYGPVDSVAKTRWIGQSLIVEEREWSRPGEEPTSVRQILWLDDRGFLNMEVSSPRPVGQSDSTTVVMKRDAPLLH
jgi:endonuclease YncB( thermonuclease family)